MEISWKISDIDEHAIIFQGLECLGLLPKQRFPIRNSF